MQQVIGIVLDSAPLFIGVILSLKAGLLLTLPEAKNAVPIWPTQTKECDWMQIYRLRLFQISISTRS